MTNSGISIGQEIESIRVLSKRSYYNFFKIFWPTICTETLVESKILKMMCDECEIVVRRLAKRLPKTHDVLFEVPPGTSKTSVVGYLLNPWAWIIDPSLRIINSSHDLTLSTKILLKSKDCIKSELYQQCFGHLFKIRDDMDNKRVFWNNKGGERMAFSVNSKPTGSHAHLILPDDLLDKSQAGSIPAREAASLHATDGLQSRCVDDTITATIMTGQRLHSKDPNQAWRDRNGETTRIFTAPASNEFPVSPPEMIALYTDGLLDPIRKPYGILEKKRKSLGEIEYATQYGQQPKAVHGNILKDENFELENVTPKDCHFVVGYRYVNNKECYGLLTYQADGKGIALVDYWESSDLTAFVEKLKSLKIEYHSYESSVYAELTTEFKPHLTYINASIGEHAKEVKTKAGDIVNRLISLKPELKTIIKANLGRLESFLEDCKLFPNGESDMPVSLLSIAIQKNRESQTLGMNWFEVDYKKLVTEVKPNINTVEDLWSSWDFNYDPCTSLIAQKLQTGIVIYKTIQETGGTAATAKSVLPIRLKQKGHFKVTGDASGNSKSSNSGARTNYDSLAELLILSRGDIVIRRANKSHKYSRALCNAVFANIPVTIYGPENIQLIRDILNAIVDGANENLFKDRDKGLGMDAADCLRYLFDVFFPNGIVDVLKYKQEIEFFKNRAK